MKKRKQKKKKKKNKKKKKKRKKKTVQPFIQNADIKVNHKLFAKVIPI
eukprot:CAMPEP_0204821512 /NCGR_PEP_ID=MMETSP1018-20131115/21340_1 /ASSEMBLY_ACC=CAM_ASM_000518 /TAXON_ID=46462 /ORGANISM="Anophryoides haemophila, Strain AH6" /LENGTH=47 /DNA_ID= /DNA_START= /DNA_END= /DNA_ORIENTATION=